ncbi:MAG TPA: glycosyltransferase family 39 protein [Phenylobacterium sp.]|nr:glycosyltransferase family 39 protein [Phenylobacterium sp.]
MRTLSAGQTAFALIVGFSLLRLVSAGVVGLGVDEAYTAAIARQLQLSYFDHPPLHLWLVHLFGGLLGYGRAARLPFVLLFGGSCWLLFALTRRLFGSRAAVWSVLILNLSGFFTVAAGSWILPDGPLIFCLLAAACHLARVFIGADDRGTPHSGAASWSWLVAGAWIGLAGLSKYQAVLFAFGVAVLLISTPRGRASLKGPWPYLAALLAGLIVSPVLIWNAQNHWASFTFQGGRAAPSHGLRPIAVMTALAGQAALLLPWVFAPLALAAGRALRLGPADQRRWFCIALGAPGIVLFALTPVWGQTPLPHWAMPSWLFLVPLLADRLARAEEDDRRWPKVWAVGSLVACLALWAIVAGDAHTGWAGRTWPAVFKKGDPTLETVEWTALGPQVADLAILREPNAFVVSMKWNEAGRLEPLVADRAAVTVFSDDPRGFGYMRPAGSLVGQDALIVVKPEDLGTGLDRVSQCFAHVEPLKVATLGRLGRPELQLHLFAGHDLLAACSELGKPTASALDQWRALKAHDRASARL